MTKSMRGEHSSNSTALVNRHSTPGTPGKRTAVEQLYAQQTGVAPAPAAPRPTPGDVFDQAIHGSPSSLPYRADMEAVFGTDFSNVRAHLGRGADMARLGAHGAAVGEDVVFASSAPDRRLVAHELTHVVQARRGGGQRTDGQASRPSDPAEGEAQEIAAEAERALTGGPGAESPRLASRIQPAAPIMRDPAHGADTPEDRALAVDGAEVTHGSDVSAAAMGDAALADTPGAASASRSGTPASDPPAASPSVAATQTPNVTTPVAPVMDAVHPEPPPPAPGGAGPPPSSHAVAASNARTPPSSHAAPGSSAGLAQPATTTSLPRVRVPMSEALIALDRVTATTLGPALGAVDQTLHHGLLAAHARVAEAVSAPRVSAGRAADTATPQLAMAMQPIATTTPAMQPIAAIAPAMHSADSTTPDAQRAASPMPAARPAETTRPMPPPQSAPPAMETRSAPATGATSPPAASPQLRDRTASPSPSAGHRPRVALVGEAAPQCLDLRQHHSAARLDDHAGQPLRHAAARPTRERVSTPPPPPRLPAPIVRAPLPTTEPRFLAAVPPQRRPAVEAAVTPVLQGRVREVQARAGQAQTHHDAAQAALDATHHARQAELAREQSAVSIRGAAEVNLTQKTWQAESQRIRTERQRSIDAHRVQVQTRIGALATQGDHDVDTSMNYAESDASARLAAAKSQAETILAAGRDRAAAARASASQAAVYRDAVSSPSLQDAGSGGEAEEAQAQQEALALLQYVMGLTQAMLAAASDHNFALVAELRQQIAQLLTGAEMTIDDLVNEAIGQFGALAMYYQTTLDQALDRVDGAIHLINWALVHDTGDYVTRELDLIAAALGEIDSMLSEVISISSFDTITDLAAEFGLTFDGLDRDGDGDYDGKDLNGDGDVYDPGEGESWSSTDRQIATLGAILTERAFRGAATGGQLANLGFGDAFRTIMGPINMNIANGARGGQTFYRNGQHEIDWYRGVSNERRGDNLPNHLGLGDTDQEDYEALLFNVIHEFGHVFDGRSRAHGRIDTYQAEKSGDLPADGAMDAVMGLAQRGDNGDKSYEEFADLFLNFVTGRFTGTAGGREAETWFRDHLFGDTSPESIPQDDWGWADIALDRARGQDSQWVTYSTQYWYDEDEEAFLENIASYYGVSHEALAAANGVGNIDEIPHGWIIIPGREPPTSSDPRTGHPE